MPLAYPNLDHRQFNYSVTSSTDANDINALTRLPASLTSLADSQLPAMHSFQAEAKIVTDYEADQAKASRRTSRVAQPAIATIAVEEERLNRELESAQKSSHSSSSLAAKESPAASLTDDPQTTMRRAMLQRMKSLTMAKEDTCETYLAEADYNLEAAVQTFYQNN